MNGDHEPVTVAAFRRHEREADTRALAINTLQNEVKHLTAWKQEVELDFKDERLKRDEQHAENIKAMGKIKVEVAKIVSIGIGIWIALTFLKDFIKPHVG